VPVFQLEPVGQSQSVTEPVFTSPATFVVPVGQAVHALLFAVATK
jgi:hypothetical protein